MTIGGFFARRWEKRVNELGHPVTGAGRDELSKGAMDNVIQNENPVANALNPPEPSRIKY